MFDYKDGHVWVYNMINRIKYTVYYIPYIVNKWSLKSPFLWIIKIEPYKMPKDILKTTNFKYVSAGKGIADNLKALESSGIE